MTRIKYAVFVLAGALLVIFTMRAATRILNNAVQAMNPAATERPVIIIDPGHGGIDGGAVGKDGIVEKDINLSLSLIMRDLFLLNGFDVVMTREEDISIHDPGVKGTRKQKTSDMRNRLAIQNKYPNAIFISVHQNKFGDSSSRGAQVFFGAKNAESEKLANILQQNIIRLIQPDNKRQPKKGQKNLFLIYEAKCTAVLLECGFISNHEEARKLADAEYQSQIAFAALGSVMEHIRISV